MALAPEDSGEYPALTPEFQVFGVRERCCRTPFLALDRDQDEFVGILHRQRPQDEAVDNAEYGCVEADADRQGEDRHRGETGILAQQPDPEINVFPEGSHVSPDRCRPDCPGRQASACIHDGS